MFLLTLNIIIQKPKSFLIKHLFGFIKQLVLFFYKITNKSLKNKFSKWGSAIVSCYEKSSTFERTWFPYSLFKGFMSLIKLKCKYLTHESISILFFAHFTKCTSKNPIKFKFSGNKRIWNVNCHQIVFRRYKLFLSLLFYSILDFSVPWGISQ